MIQHSRARSQKSEREGKVMHVSLFFCCDVSCSEVSHYCDMVAYDMTNWMLRDVIGSDRQGIDMNAVAIGINFACRSCSKRRDRCGFMRCVMRCAFNLVGMPRESFISWMLFPVRLII